MMKNNSILKKTIVLAIVIFFIVSVNPGFAENTITPENSEYVISLDFDSFELSFGTQAINDYDYATITLLDEGFTTNIGQAKLPMMRAMIEIPQGSYPEIAVLSESWESTTLSELNLPDRIIPVQLSVEKGKGTPDSAGFVFDNEFYDQDIFSPIDTVNIVETGEIRKRRFVLVEISPIQYNPSNGELQLLNSCSIEIQIESSNLEKTYQYMQRYYSPAYENLFKTAFINYGELENNIVISQKDPEGFLFIVYDNFYDEIQPLVDMKESKGFDVTVTRTSEIPGGCTVANIEDYIEDAYINWTIPPTYILLVGDTGQVPTKTIGLEWGVSCTDLYYVTINPGDYFPDIYIGRFPAASPAHVTAMVDKTVYYEEGDFPSDDWIKKAAFLASVDNYQISEGTHNYVIDNYLKPNQYFCDKLYQVTYGATTQDVHDSINDGKSLVIYSGHGATTFWADGPHFAQGDVNGLFNDEMYPFVVSHACVTGTFNYGECFGETWLRAEGKGALAFWGATCNTLWDEDDILEKRVFQAWWEDDLGTIGRMTDMGLIYLYNYYGGAGYSQYYFEGYNVLGDPSIVLVGKEGGGNTPPNKPETPEGPEEGKTGFEYTFTTTTTDPDNDDVYYLWYWGNEISDWLGPYNSGEVVEIPHIWNTPGEFEIKVKVKDKLGYQSGWSDTISINILAAPLIEIGEITGGFGVSAVIKNIGAGEAENVEWTIQLQGLVVLGREKTGKFDKIMPGFGPSAKTGFVLGFGPIQITVTADEAEKKVNALLIGPFVLNIEE